MKFSILIFSALMLSLFLVACSKYEKGNVKARFINLTGYELNKLRIGDNRIGTLDIMEQTGYFSFEEFAFDSGIPTELIRAKIDSRDTRDYSEFYWCGTSKYRVTEGTFDIEIRRFVINDIVYLRLDKK